MKFNYVGKKPSGQVVKGTIEADSVDKAEEALWKAEITINTVQNQLERLLLGVCYLVLDRAALQSSHF